MCAKLFAIAVLTVMCAVSFEARAEPPGDVLASGSYPIRIFYQDDTADFAAGALEQAEAAWADAIDVVGMTPPLRMVADQVEEGFDVGLDLELPGVGTYEVLGNHDDTTQADCPTLAWFNPLASPSAEILTMTMHHLLTRQSLRAVDCIEPFKPAYDMFAVAFGVYYMGPDHPYWMAYELPAFQASPWKSIDYLGTTAEEAFYAYGCALFTLFLDETFGAGDGVLLQDIWNLTAQDGVITSWSGPMVTADVDNEPDYLDAIAATLEDEGSSFDEAFIEFVEWRFFMGADDDGAHSSHAADWTGGETTRDSTHGASDLPAIDVGCANNVAEYGSTYIQVDPSGLDGVDELTFEFDGNPEKSWWAGLFLIPETGAASVEEIELTDEYAGELVLPDPSSHSQIIMAVANLGDGEHDADDDDTSTFNGDFTYSITWPGADADSDTDSDADTDTDADADGDADGGAADSEDSSGCGCRATGRATAPISLTASLFSILFS